jgi:hypothetical protein
LRYFCGRAIEGAVFPYKGYELSRAVWADAQVLEIAIAEASAIAVTFMIVSFV